MSELEPMRVRFAPSPTGYLHVGGARTALFNWLLARRHGGVFILRIEDTDRERSDTAMTTAILDSMTWLGLDWDEGPYHQVDGTERHRSDALSLLAAGRAYRCFCTAELLDGLRAAHPDGPDAFRYDRRCAAIPTDESDRRAAAGEAHTVRFRVPAGETAWHDVVHDDISFANADIEDFIILRTDGTPIYNLAVVSDDVDMRITHVIRGADHISNTPKQIMLYEALGQPVPVFAHVPLILGPDGKRLSKRHGATAVGEYRTLGILPDALANFLALLGWSSGSDQEIFTRAGLTAVFALEGINKKAAIFDHAKLEWMNGRYLAEAESSGLLPLVREFVPASGQADDWWLTLIDLLKLRSRTVVEIADQARPYLTDPVPYDPEAVTKHWKDTDVVADRLTRLADRLADLSPWDEHGLEGVVRAFAEGEGIGAGKLIHPLRIAVTGVSASPGIFAVLSLLGKERALGRIAAAVAYLGARDGPPLSS